MVGLGQQLSMVINHVVLRADNFWDQFWTDKFVRGMFQRVRLAFGIGGSMSQVPLYFFQCISVQDHWIYGRRIFFKVSVFICFLNPNFWPFQAPTVLRNLWVWSMFSQRYTWVFPKIRIPQNGWFKLENPIKMDDLGVPLFSETLTLAWKILHWLTWGKFWPQNESIPLESLSEKSPTVGHENSMFFSEKDVDEINPEGKLKTRVFSGKKTPRKVVGIIWRQFCWRSFFVKILKHWNDAQTNDDGYPLIFGHFPISLHL